MTETLRAIAALHYEVQRYYDNGYSQNAGLPYTQRECLQCGSPWPCATRSLVDLELQDGEK